jgi:glyoxylase-like metal-dependent hydrolase (beta-lactamase superfamily II)
MDDGKWVEVGDGVLARRYAELDQTLGLVLGASNCLVIDTGTDEVHGAGLAAAIREVTPLPWTVLITHSHWDHFLGTAAFEPCAVLAHPLCRKEIVENGDAGRQRRVRRYLDEGRPEMSERLRAARIVAPTELLPDRAEVTLGDRVVTLLHPGRGHTNNDVVVHVPDAGVLFAGDLVEQGAPPALGLDAYPLEWPSTMDALLALDPQVVVPGHGNPVDAEFTRTQREELAVVAEVFRAVRAGETTAEEAVARYPYSEEHMRRTLERANG